MKKGFKRFLIMQAVILALVCGAAFLINAELPSRICAVAAQLVNTVILLCVFKRAFEDGASQRSRFIKLPTASVCLISTAIMPVAVILTLVFAAALPVQAGCLAAVILLTILGTLPADGEKKQSAQTAEAPMRALQTRVTNLASQCANPIDSRAVTSLISALKYSAPEGNENTADAEKKLLETVDALEKAIKSGSGEIEKLSREAQSILKERNKLIGG